MNLRFLFFLFAATALLSCKKETADFQPVKLTDYLPLVQNKYITYRLDSTVFTNFGRNVETRVYQEKHVIDGTITDNQNRTGYRVFVYQRDSAGIRSWTPTGSYSVFPTAGAVEITTDNLRQVKLVLPLEADYSWKGNRFLTLEPYSVFYNFSNDDNMGEWDYTYREVNETITLNGRSIPNVITIEQVNESLNVPITIPTAYASINFAVDRFAKGIGLVYQELVMWEYQPNPGGPSPYRIGFGVKRSMIDHN
jgi:hypothetical protein